MTTPKPLPCPFCGGAPAVETAHITVYSSGEDRVRWFVACSSCASEGQWAYSHDGAVSVWNNRSDGAVTAHAALQLLWDKLVDNERGFTEHGEPGWRILLTYEELEPFRQALLKIGGAP